MKNDTRVLAYNVAEEINKDALKDISGGANVANQQGALSTHKITGIQSLDFEWD